MALVYGLLLVQLLLLFVLCRGTVLSMARKLLQGDGIRLQD